MAEQPPLNRIYVFGYSANDRDYPIVSLTADPRVAGYQVPKDLSACPDKRYPNHVFTGAQPIAGDQRVRHVWEILPSPWVPFTRYDDDLGPIQGRRRSVKNEGQVASLAADKRTTYEAREGSAIVYTELEETWSIKVDEDGNSLFPIRDRDFYDPSRGPVQERRQLFVPTGDEVGSLENVNGVITQTSYEPYNEFLSVKIVQTYKVDGPQLIGKATDNEGQLVTITTQRKAADGYVPPNPTATRTVEASREDAESLVERIVDTPQVFGAEVYRKTREDITPQKFKAAQEDTTSEQNIEGTASPTITLSTGEFAKSEQQINKFVKRVSTTSRAISEAVTLVEKVLTNEGQVGTRTLNLQAGDQSFTPSATMVDANVEALGDGRTVKTEVVVPSVFAGKTVQKTRIDLTPEKFKAKQEDVTTEESVAGSLTPVNLITLGAGEFRKSEQQVTEFVKRVSTTTRDISATQTLSESLVTPQGQVATRTLNLVTVDPDNPPVLTPDAKTIDASIEALGDGRAIITNVTVGNFFDDKSLSVQKSDTVPEKFKVGNPTIREEVNVAKSEVGNEDGELSLGEDEISKTEKRISEYLVQSTKVTRGSTYETIDNIDLDESWGIGIPYQESIAKEFPQDTNNKEIEGLGGQNYLIRSYEDESLDDALDDFKLTIPTSIDLQLPRVLDKIALSWDITENLSEVEVDTTGIVGSFDNLTQSDNGSITSDLGLVPKFEIIFKDFSGSDIPATINIFFLKSSSVTENSILAKCGTNVKRWPAFKPKSFFKTVYGINESKTLALDISRAFSKTGFQPSKSKQTSTRKSLVPVNINIPPCLTEEKTISITNELKLAENTDSKITLLYEAVTNTAIGVDYPEVKIEDTLKHEIKVNDSLSIPKTDPVSIPATGTYLISSTAEPYRFGWFLIRATTIDAGIFAETSTT